MPVLQLAEELQVASNTLRRWADEYHKNKEASFPGNGKPCINKDYEILKLKKEIEELQAENEILKNSGPS